MKSEFLTTSSTSLAVVPAAPEGLSLARAGEVEGRVVGNSFSPGPLVGEETLVIDDRCGLSPAQLVETRLTRKLQETSLPVSHLQMRGLLGRR